MAKRVFKTVKKLSSTKADKYRKWSEWHEGDTIIGKYIPSSIDKYKKPNWLFEVVQAEFVKKPKLAKSLEGKTLGLNSNGALDRAMENATVGDLIQITYEGKETMDGGPYAGKEKHILDINNVEEDDGSEMEQEEEY